MIADRPAGRRQIEAYYRFRLRIFFENLSSASPNSIAPGQPEPALFQIEEVLSQCERSGWAAALRAHRASSRLISDESVYPSILDIGRRWSHGSAIIACLADWKYEFKTGAMRVCL